MSMVGPEIIGAYNLVPGLAGSSRKQKRNITQDRLTVLQRLIQRTLTEMCMNRFDWKGFPDTVEERYLELELYHKALVIFYNDADYGYLAMSGGTTGQPNHYGDPTGFNIYGNGRFTREVSAREAVPIWSNYLRAPDHDIVYVYSTKLAEIDLTIEINARNARIGKMAAFSENVKLSAENILRQIEGGDPVIKVTPEAMEQVSITPLDFSVHPDAIEKLHILRTRLYNECMGLLGINNSNQDKKERLVEAEVGANDDQINATRQVNLNSRRMACKKINKMFPDLNVSVDYYKPTDTLADDPGENKPADSEDAE